MICSDRTCKGILSFWCILFYTYSVADARRYDKCTTQDGRQGVCVVKKYCREATSHLLLPCEGDDENHCCPIPTTLRSAQSPRLPEQPRDSTSQSRTEQDHRRPDSTRLKDNPRREEERRTELGGQDRQRHDSEKPRRGDRPRIEDDRRHEVPKERDKPRYDEQPRLGDDNKDISRPEIARERDRPQYDDRPKLGDGDKDISRHEIPRERDRPRYDERPRSGDDDLDARRPEIPRGRDKPRYDERPRLRDVDKDISRSEIPRERDKPRYDERPRLRDVEKDISRSEIPRERDKPRYDERPRVGEDDRDRHRLGLSKDDFDERDDRLNKTPPPGDRRSPTRHQPQRPKNPDWDRTQDDDIFEKEKRRPAKNHGYPSQEDRQRDKDTESRPPSNRPVDYGGRDPPVRRPDRDRFYPKREELHVHRTTDPPTRMDKKNETYDWSKAPIRFPDAYEFSVPRPKVPACGVKPYELFIAGGTESEEHEWPWMTAIFRRHPDSRPKTFLCGGSLINTKYVLTAAHCFVNNYVVLPASAFVVRLGSHFLDSGEEYTVSNLVIHHNHSGSDFFNDIALVRLASEVYITDKIAPICLPYPDMMRDNLVGRMATVAGWGDTSFRSSGTRILQHVTVPVVSGEECFAAYSRVRGAAFLARGSDHVICAGLREGGKDACLGDSGGPLMLKMADDRWVVVGIVSLGYKCAEPGYPGVYTRVTHYMSWINTNMKRH